MNEFYKLITVYIFSQAFCRLFFNQKDITAVRWISRISNTFVVLRKINQLVICLSLCG